MLVQDFLRRYTTPEYALDALESKYAIKNKRHEDGRVILQYCQINSPKLDPLARECRGLILDTLNDYSLVGRSFYRFLNLGEDPNDKFNHTSQFLAVSKEDGSLITVCQHNGFKVHTRFSFSDSLCGESGWTWEQLVRDSVDFSRLNPRLTYVFELVGPHNRIVTNYDDVGLFLLSINDGQNEFPWEYVLAESDRIRVSVPAWFVCADLSSAREHVERLERDNPTAEGLVLRDNQNNRIKLKSKSYLRISKLFQNGNLFSVKCLLPILLANEQAEILIYYPELHTKFAEIQQRIESIKRELTSIYEQFRDLPLQKDFAQAILKSGTKYTDAMFSARKTGREPYEFLTADYLLKYGFADGT